MIFSVYNYPEKVFYYFESSSVTPPTAWFRSPAGTVSRPEVLATKLSADAKPLGKGVPPRGVIATTEARMGSTDPSGADLVKRPSPLKAPLLVLLGVVVGWFWASK